jgi:hypothetical protein
MAKFTDPWVLVICISIIDPWYFLVAKLLNLWIKRWKKKVGK